MTQDGLSPKLNHEEAIGFVARCIARAPKLSFIVGAVHAGRVDVAVGETAWAQ